jgi:hypothetical protein
LSCAGKDRVLSTRIIVEDGFFSLLDGRGGTYEPGMGYIILPSRYLVRDLYNLFHELTHVVSGHTSDRIGLTRLTEFMDTPDVDDDHFDYYWNALFLLNEAFTNVITTQMAAEVVPDKVSDEFDIDSEIVKVIQSGGTPHILDSLFHNAYFSDNIKDVEILAAIIAKVHSKETIAKLASLWTAIESASSCDGDATYNNLRDLFRQLFED